MPWTFDNLDVHEKAWAIQEAQRLRIPLPTDAGKANTVFLPVGPQHGRGWLLMTRGDLAKQANFFETLHTLTIDTVKLGGWLPLQARRLFPGADKDPHSLYLVEIVDGRWRCDNPHYCQAGTKQFNVRAPDTGGLVYVDPVAGDVTWTWDSMSEDIWGSMSNQLSSYPTLGWSPYGTPESWIFIGVSAYAGMNEVLDKLDMVIAPNLDGTFRLVQLGQTNTAEVRNLTKQLQRYQSQNLMLDDDQPLSGTWEHMPGTVRVISHVSYANYGEENTTTRETAGSPGGAWQMAPSHGFDYVNPYGGDPAVTHPLWDDLPAVWSSTANAPINTTALNARGQERADHFFQSLHGCPRVHQTYSGALPIVPGSTLKGVAWRQDDEGGTITEIYGHPNRRVSITDDGRWKTLRNEESNTSIRPPDFRPKTPLYPQLMQIVFVNKLTPGGAPNSLLHPPQSVMSVFNGKMGQFDSAALGWNPREPVWVIADSFDNQLTQATLGPDPEDSYRNFGHSFINADDTFRRMAMLVDFYCPHAEDGTPTPGYEGDCRPLFKTIFCAIDEAEPDDDADPE